MIEGFINKTFDKDKNGKDMFCLLDANENGPADIATDLFRTIQQVQADKVKFMEQKRTSDVQMKDISVPFDRARLRHLSGKAEPLEMKDNDDTILDWQNDFNGAQPFNMDFKLCKASV